MVGPTGGDKARHLRLWAAVAGSEAASRLLLQVLTTAVLARLVSPDDFGLSALALTLVTIFNVFTAMPFEEALAQRRIVRGAHVKAALMLSWIAAAVFLVVAIGAGAVLGHLFDAPAMATVLPVAATLLFPNSVVILATAVARRRRRFNAVALSSFAGNLCGAVVAIAVGVAGGGIWALIAFRLATVFTQAVVIASLLRFGLSARWSTRHLKDIGAFAWFVLWDKLADNLTYLVFNYLVGGVFGLTVLGHFNMAMRVIEPIRGAVVAIGHNLSFSLFLPNAHDRQRLGTDVAAACHRLTVMTAPTFLGIAATAPLLIPAFAGPGWDEAIPMTEMLAVGSALFTATQLVMTGLSTAGEPMHSVYRGGLRLAVISLALFVCAPIGALAVGLSRLAGDLSDALVAADLSHRRLGLTRWRLIGEVARPLLLAAAMAAVVLAVEPWLHRTLGLLPALGASIAIGVAAYGALLLGFDRPAFAVLRADLLGRRA